MPSSSSLVASSLETLDETGHTSLVQVVAEAVDSGRASPVAAEEARCATITAEKEASTTVQYVAIAVDKVEADVEAVKISTTIDANSIGDSVVKIHNLFCFREDPQI